jgi:hypothetical protein
VRLTTKNAGYVNAARYKSIDSVSPKISYAAVYELESAEALGGPVNQGIVNNASDHEKDVISRLETLHWRLYKPIKDSAVDYTDLPKPASLNDYAKYFTATAVDVTPEHDKEFNDWFHEEHIPLFAKVPGFVRVRRFELAASGDLAGSLGEPKHYLCFHESSDPKYQEYPEFKALSETPGMKKIIPWLTNFEERKFELYRDFGPATA